MSTFVIVGAGLAGAKTAEGLRERDYQGEIVLLGDEPHRPYERPPLSKGYLTGSTGRDAVFVHAPEWYAEHQVQLRVESTVSGVDRVARQVQLADGDRLGYDKLLLSTGAAPRRLSVPGAEAAGVHYLRSLDESESLKRLFSAAGSLVVIGAGWIGLEAAAAARAAGLAVTVVESAELPLLRVLGPEVAEVFAQLHRDHQVELRLGATLSEISTKDGQATGVRLADGSSIAADAVLVAVGVAPNSGLAADCGLAVDNGIVVDDALRTSDPDIFAVGDVANAFHPVFNRHIRVEHWANALNQPAVAAASMTGAEASYQALPYFFTDQYELGMEYVGYVEPGGYDRVVFRGDVASREFIAFWLAGNRVLAGMNVNIWDVTDPIKALIRSGVQLDPEQLADPARPLESFAG
ncbi:MAG: FAD-dependent oxidoreductase [Actinomycetota bacterium]|nr:FAD-dependent oxidoreductase [Actinomycetota bacterium]MDQ2956282.1 FAD-dependent oxidoreductase [Actinomycetota bacterium]